MSSAALSLTSDDILGRLPSTIRHPKKRAFLAAYAVQPSVTMATRAAGIRRDMHYDWMRDDEVYREAFAEVKEMGIELLEVEAIRRARDGWDEPVFYKGEKTGVTRKHSDTLLIFMLKAARPGVYKERVGMEHSGPDGGPMRHEVAMTARGELAVTLAEINRRLSASVLEIEGEEQ